MLSLAKKFPKQPNLIFGRCYTLRVIKMLNFVSEEDIFTDPGFSLYVLKFSLNVAVRPG